MKRRAGNGPELQAALERAALLGRGFPLPLLTGSGVPQEAIAVLLDEGTLVNAARAPDVKFASASMPRKILESVPWSRVRDHHLALGDAARRQGFPAEKVAGHFEAAHRFDLARMQWIRAGEAACANGDYRGALRSMDRALSIWPWDEAPEDRLRVLRETARCAGNARMNAAATKAWEELAAQSREAGLHALRVEALHQLAGLSDDPVKTGGFLTDAAELASRELSPAEAYRHGIALVDHLATRVRTKLARQAFVAVEDAAGKSADPAILSEMLGWKGLLAAMGGEAEEAKRHVDEALRLAIKHKLPAQVAIAYKRHANIADYVGDYARQKEAHGIAIGYCTQAATGDEVVCMSCLSYACFRTGDWSRAIRTADEVLRVPELPRALGAIALGIKGMVAVFQGNPRPAMRHLAESLVHQRAEGLVGLELLTLWAIAYCHGQQGNHAEAGSHFDEIRALWRETDDVHDSIPGLLFAGAHYASAGKMPQLADCIDILGQIQRRNDLPECRAALLALGAEQARLEGDEAAAARSFEEAVKLQIKAGLPLERLWIETRRGEDCDKAGALSLAIGLGAKPLLPLLGKRDDGISRPTPRQQEVLEHLAAGLTSKEIADRMALSTRTVEMHVGRLLERLGCRTRPEAVALAQSSGWLKTGHGF